ncbi:hypothetical protein P167DRAFT_575362 [Morchella conica CCBAS932]|uniref:1-phosphatidylinositol-3-phosphate 5-kinase n=1 Tax=Morchella conica CCBAS932 TaxID=1392247 RepID=A0A3N4KPJ4_9PEZI|nr:hypothetical protein P167DRAFT_575362 [Morchella conica CCBAS932]
MFSFRRAEADPQSASAIPDHVIERPRRGSVMSLSQTLYSLDSTPPPPADLEQIHASSSQAPGLTSFSLASPPSGSTEQLSFNNLYSRVKRVASAVRDVVSVPVRDGASRMSLGSIGSDRYQGHADSRDSFMSSATIDSEDSNYPVLPTSPLSPIKSQFGKHSRITSSSSLQSSSRVSSNNSMASTAMAGDYAPPAALRKVNLRASNSGAPVPSLAPITVFRDGDGSEFVSLTSPGLGVKGMSDVSRKDNEANLQNSAKEKAAGVQRTTVNALLGAAGTVVGGTVGYPPLPVSKTVEDESGARAENDEESNSSASEEDGGAISDSSDDDIILLNSRLPGGHEGDKIGTYGSKAIKVAGSSSESQPVSVQRSSSKDIPAPLNINNSNHLPPSTTGSDVASGTSLESNAASFVNNRLQSPGTSPSAIKSAINLPPKGDKNSPSSNQQTNVPGKPSLPPPNSPMAGSGETARKQRPTVSKISTDQASLLPGFSVTREASSESGSSQDATSTADVGKHSGGSSMYQYREGFQDGMVNGGNTGPNGGVGTGNSEAVSQALRQLRMGNLTSDFWMKDELCKECFLCANTFGVFRRKHHCRLCGQIFCSKCTTLISGDRFQHQGSMRVCSPCLEIVNEYQDESESEDDFSPASVFHIHQPIDQRHEMQSGPGSVVGTPIGGPMTPGFSMPRESRPATTPLMAIPASRITAGSNPNRRSQILEINAEIPSPPRPPSSRSGKSPMSFSRPLTANALKLPQHGHSHSHSHHHHHKHQHSRSHRWFPAANANERAPFHRNVADELGLQGALPAFHSDSIIDPDLAPYMSDDASDDEQMSIFATIAPKYGEAFGNLFSTSAAGSQSGQAGGISLGLNGATSTMSKIRRAASINGINALLNAGGSDNGKSGLLPPTRSSRKRNSSFLGNIQPRPVTRGKGHRNLMRSLVGSVSDASAFGGAGSSAMPSPRASRSASMRGPLAPSIELNTASLQHVRTLLRQLLGDANIKEVDKWERALMPILLKSTDDLNPDIRSGDIIDIRHYVKVKKIPGGKPGDTTYVSGVVFTKNLALKSMPRNIAHPRIVVVTFPIEYQRHQQQLMSLEPVIAQEKDYLQKMVARITSLRPTLLLVEKNISGVALQLLAQANVATTHLVKPSVIEAVARCAGADICSSVDKLLLHNFRVGRCASFDVKTFVHEDIPEKKKTFMYLSGCPKELGCTIVLRGGDMETLAVLKQITEMMIYVVYNLKLETCLMRDEFVNIPSSSSIAPTPTVVPTAAPQTDAPTAAFDDPEKTLSTEDGQENLAASENQEKSPNSRSEESERMAGGVPDDIPSPTYYEDMVKNHETKVLSASPFVKYMQPYLLMRARELERKLVYLKRLRDSQVVEDDEQTEFGSDGRVGELEEHVENEKSADPDKPVEKFELIQPEMVDANVKNGTKKMIEVLRAIHDAEYDKALHVYETQKKQWENYLSQYDDLFDPYAHQNIAILYSLVCTLTTVPCEGPELRRLGFYIQGMDWPLGKSDCTLGQYVELLCNTANKQCESDTCDKKMIDHHRSYVHGQARVSVLVSDKMACPIQGMQDTILMWSYCKVCPNTNTPAIPMSESTWKYSFGKYLELAFWSSEMKLRAGNCPHDLNRDHVRCFGYRGLTVVFQYDPIDLLEIVVPRTKITYQPEIDLRIKNEQYLQHEERTDRFFSSVKSRLKSINIDSVPADKIDACKAEIETLTTQAENEHSWLIKKLQEKYNKSKYFEIIPLNRALRALQERVVDWDARFNAFDNNYFPSEKDIRRLATLQLKKIFIDNPSTPNLQPGERTPTPEKEDLGKAASIVDGSAEMVTSPTEMSPKQAHDVLASVVEEDIENSKGKSAKNEKEDSTEDKEDAPSITTVTPEPISGQGGLSQFENMDHLTPRQEVSLEQAALKTISPEPSAPNSPIVPIHPKIRSSPAIVESEGAKSDSDTPGQPAKNSGSRASFEDSKVSVDGPRASFESPRTSLEGSRRSLEGSRKSLEGPRTSLERLSSERERPTNHMSSIPRFVDARRKLVAPPLNRTQSTPHVPQRKGSDGVPSGLRPLTHTPSFPLKKPSVTEAIRKHNAEKAKSGKGPEKFRFASLNKKSPQLRDTQIPRSVPTQRRKDTKVATIAKQIEQLEQLSREFEKERVREKRLSAAKRTRALPVATSRPIVEVYRNVAEAVEEVSDEEPHEPMPPSRETSNMTVSTESTIQTESPQEFSTPEITMTPEPVEEQIEEYHAQPNQMVQSDVDMSDGEISFSSDHEANIQPPIIDVLPPNPDTPLIQKHEKSAWTKMLSNFWAERSASGWSSLEYPLHPTDHVFNDSDVIVREDEPSSLIAFALNCEDYATKLDAIRSADEGPTSSEDCARPTAFNADEHPELERSLLRTTGTHLKYQFQEGSAKMFCKIFFAEQFDALRRNCGVADRYVESLSRCIKWDSKGGKTKSVFLKTQDERFVLKALAPIETAAFIKFAPAYFQFMAEAFFHELPTVIAKMLGFYQIMIKNPTTGIEIKWDVLVMENLFYDRKTTRIFDLKGSMRNRYMQSTGDQNEVLLDENMIEFIYESPLFVREHSKKLLRASLWNDTLFLSRQNVMDYSLMIGIDEVRKELCVGIIDCIRTFTWDKKLESWVKEKGFAGGGNKKPTVTSPREYKHRFREAMERYVLEAPRFACS